MKKLLKTLTILGILALLASPAQSYMLQNWTFDLSSLGGAKFENITDWVIDGESTTTGTFLTPFSGTFEQSASLDVVKFVFSSGFPSAMEDLYFETDNVTGTFAANSYDYTSGDITLNYRNGAVTTTIANFSIYDGGGIFDDGIPGGTGDTGTVNIFANMDVLLPGIFIDQYGDDLVDQNVMYTLGFLEGGFTVQSVPNPIDEQDNISITISDVAGKAEFQVVPVPASVLLLGPGLVALGGLRRRFMKKA